MLDLRPFVVTAPLTINTADVLDTNTIYVFDYEDSFTDEEDKPSKMINYLESFGGMFDLLVDIKIPYEEKEQLILNYFNAGSFFNVYSLVQTMIHIVFTYKDIQYSGERSILTDGEIIKFIDRNKTFMTQVIELYDSLFLIMLLYGSNPIKDMNIIKEKYSSERIKDDELSPNLCCVLLDNMFYDYYSKHVGENIYYYTFLFDNRLYKSMTFVDILTNKNNNLLPVLIDMTNNKFMEFIEQNKKEN